MGEVTGLQQLSIPLMPLETIARTQKVLADEASPRAPPRSPPSHPNPQISEAAYPASQACLCLSGVLRYFLLKARQKNWGRARLNEGLTISQHYYNFLPS